MQCEDILEVLLDFEGYPITTPFIGLYTKLGAVPIDSCTFTYGQWSICNGSFQTRPYTSNPAGCVGHPPLDSIQRTCSNIITVTRFYYNSSRTSIRIESNISGTITIQRYFA